MTTARSVDDYIAGFTPEVRSILRKIRSTIRRAAPGAEEAISYQIPVFKIGGSAVIYFAAYKKHIGLYPPVRGNARLLRAVARYRGAKGNLKFPLDEPIPYELIRRIAGHKVRAHAAKVGSGGRRRAPRRSVR